MELGRYESIVTDKNILCICRKLAGEGARVFQICERYGMEADEIRKYDTYKVETNNGTKIIKKTNEREFNNYVRYLKDNEFHVPAFEGSCIDGDSRWIMIENIVGSDLREMTDDLSCAAADTISQIQNKFWGNADIDRFDVYMKRINKRYEYIKKYPEIAPAFKLFLERQETCPRTLSNGDCLQFNTINHCGRVYIIDWGFGGIMPYSLDLARFIAHATENKATFPFYMSDLQKELFLDRMYEKLDCKPSYQQYRRDIQLALLNEYIEFVEAGEDEDGWYLNHARDLSARILSHTHFYYS